MAKVVWDANGERFFEAGVDRGVLYPKSGPGVAWNGLVSVTESPDGGAAAPLYLDGHKYHNEATPEEFTATIAAFTYPDEFEEMDGTGSSGRGLSYGQQPRHEFGLTYRTGLGNDLEGVDHGYKIHLIYDALAAPTQKTNTTHTNTPAVNTFSWGITTKPQVISGRKSTSHLVIDSTDSDPVSMLNLENILYGTFGIEPRLPTPIEVVELFDDWARLEIIPALTTGLVKLKYHGLPDLKGDGYIGLYEAPEETRLKQTTELGLYRLE